MIADAFFAFLSWVRLLFFNREMELALIGEIYKSTRHRRERVFCL